MSSKIALEELQVLLVGNSNRIIKAKKDVVVLLQEDSKLEKLKNISKYNAVHYKNINDPIFIKN